MDAALVIPCDFCPTTQACTFGGATVFGGLVGGVLTWYDSAGNPVAAAQVVPCDECCFFPASSYTDVGNGGLHCFDQPPAGSCTIPAGTWKVTAGGDTSPYLGTMRVLFSDGQQLFEDGGTYACGDFSEVAPPIVNSATFTFAGPVTATLAFEQDNGEGVPHPILSPFICYTPGGP